MAVDIGHGLSPGDAAGIMRFRERGGGVLTARDHQDLGSCLLRSVRSASSTTSTTRTPSRRAVVTTRTTRTSRGRTTTRARTATTSRSSPTSRRTSCCGPTGTASGRIEWFPAHPHEGAVSAPPEYAFAQVVGRGRSTVSGRTFNLAVALDGETTADGGPAGRAVACSTFHHFADMNWDIDAGAPSFVTDVAERRDEARPSRLDVFKDYVRQHRPLARHVPSDVTVPGWSHGGVLGRLGLPTSLTSTPPGATGPC